MDENAKIMAQSLQQQFGLLAQTYACILAYDAVSTKNLRECLFWREVLDLLEQEDCEITQFN